MWWLVLLSIHVGVVRGYSGGAPPSTCSSMFPIHNGNPARPDQPPYFFRLTKPTYTPGEVITVNLVGNNVPLKGYQIQARDAQGDIVGQFTSALGGRTINCGPVDGALTHANAMNKAAVSFTWQAPSAAVGEVNFIATVVQSYNVFWVNIISSPLSPFVAPTTERVTTPVTTRAPVTPAGTTSVTTREPPVGTSAKPPTQTTPVPGRLTMDEACGKSKGCFVKCDAGHCEYVVTWKDGPDYVDFELFSILPSDGNHWIAVAFSSDLKMGDDDTVECIGSRMEVIEVTRSYNYEGKTNRALPKDEATKGLSMASGSFKDRVFSCKFRRAKSDLVTRRKRQAADTPAMFDLNQKWHIMFGHGPATESASGFAKLMHRQNPVVTPGPVDFQSTELIGDAATFPLIKIHAILMIMAWILFTGVGIVAARYYKSVWTSTNILGQRVWFQIHRSCMVTALVLTLIGFIIIFVQVEGYSQVPDIKGKEYLQAHPPLGIIVTILAIINPIMSIFRPGPKDEKRPIFNWAHWGVGVLAHTLSVIAICFGMQMKKSTAPSYSVWVVVGYVIYHVIMELTLKSFDLYMDKTDNGRVDALAMTQTGAAANGTHYKVPPPAYSERDTRKNPKDSIVKKLLLGFHMAIALAFTITLIMLVVMYD